MKLLSNIFKSIIITAIVLMCCSPIASFWDIEFAPFSIKASALEASGMCGDTATYTFDSATGELVISGTGAIAVKAFYQNREIKTLIIGGGIETIGSKAFEDCENLLKVTLHEGITTIQSNAFSDCKNLKTILGGNSITTIGQSAFEDCSNLESINMFENVTKIHKKAFYNCDSLTTVIFGNHLTSIGDQAFSSCENLEKIIFPKSLIYIDTWAFYYSPNIESIVLYENLESIDAWAFEHVDSLTEVIIYSEKCYLGIFELFPKTTKIYGIKGSTAQKYAEENEYEFVAINVCSSHTFSSWTTNEVATCIEMGYKTRTCSKCDYLETEIIPRTNHSFSDWKLSSGTTCGSSGTKIRTCSICSYEETQAFTSAGHEYSTKWTVDKAATCTASGSKSYHCKNCDAKSNITTIPATSHSYSSWKTTKKATCKTDGTKQKTCSNCGKKVKGTIAKGAHSYTNKTSRASFLSAGNKISVCNICNYKKTSTIPKLVSVKLSTLKYTYDGKVKTPSIIAKDSAGKTLKKDVDYTVLYPNGRKTVGDYFVRVIFIGDYEDSKTLSFTIRLGKVTNLKQNKGEKGVSITWNGVKGATGYEMYIYDNKTKQYKLLKTFTDNSARNPKAKGKLTVRVRAYYKNKNGKIFYGDFSEAKTFTAIN